MLSLLGFLFFGAARAQGHASQSGILEVKRKGAVRELNQSGNLEAEKGQWTVREVSQSEILVVTPQGIVCVCGDHRLSTARFHQVQKNELVPHLAWNTVGARIRGCPCS